MIETEEMNDIKMENLRLAEENDKLRRTIAKLNQIINRLIAHYINTTGLHNV